jgi:hypothetical protein
MDSSSDLWLENGLVREDERGDQFEGISRLVVQKNPSLLRWRTVILKWYSEVTRVFKLSPITSEISLFFFDSLIAASVGRAMQVADLQLNGLVALFVASKMFGTSPQFKVADLMRLAPHLQITQREVCVMELRLLQTLQFNLFIPTTIEFSFALIDRVIAKTCYVLHEDDIRKEILQENVVKYITYLDSEFSNIEYRQSEKARAVVHCAIARWALSNMELTSKEMEKETMSIFLEVISKGPPFVSTQAIDLSLDYAALSVIKAWKEVVRALPRLASNPQDRNSHLELFILNAIEQDETAPYPTLSTPRLTLAPPPPPLAPLEAVEQKSLHMRNSIAFSSLASSSDEDEDDMTAEEVCHTSRSPVDVMDMEAHFELQLEHATKLQCESKKCCGRRSLSASHRQFDLEETTEEEAPKRQKV